MVIENGIIKMANESDVHNGELIIPDNVFMIGENILHRCKELRHLVISNSVRIIGDLAFNNCVSLEDVIIPDSVNKIGFATFSCCTNLKTVKLPHDLLELGHLAFARDNPGLTIHYDETQLQFLGGMKEDCGDIVEFVLKPYNCDIF